MSYDSRFESAKTGEGHERIEQAFENYFYRADYLDDDDEEESHEFEIIVCHLKSSSIMPISFGLCRALQIPLEAW